jgi:carrier-protein-independent halogenase WelO5-like protein
MDTLARTVRSIEISTADDARAATGIEDLYNDKLDVIVARHAFPLEPIAAAGDELDRTDRDPGWARPNEKMPVEDIQILGTHTPGTPTYQAPRGASLDAYLDSAERHRAEAKAAFPAGFDPANEIERVLGRFSGGRPVVLPRAADGRSYAPLTLRRLADGKQIGIHHDYHYPLDLYTELKPQVDTRTLVSWVVTLRKPTTGGELFVYGVTPDTPNAPKMPNGFQYDLEKIEQQFDVASFKMDVSDLFLLASGRCLHRVNRIGGPESRVTMGGFLALNKDRSTVLYWS